jgi:hypothetical protein
LQGKSDRILRFSEQLTEKFQNLKAQPFDADLLDDLRILNPEVAKEMEKLIQEQQRNKGIER